MRKPFGRQQYRTKPNDNENPIGEVKKMKVVLTILEHMCLKAWNYVFNSCQEVMSSAKHLEGLFSFAINDKYLGVVWPSFGLVERI